MLLFLNIKYYTPYIQETLHIVWNPLILHFENENPPTKAADCKIVEGIW